MKTNILVKWAIINFHYDITLTLFLHGEVAMRHKNICESLEFVRRKENTNWCNQDDAKCNRSRSKSATVLKMDTEEMSSLIGVGDEIILRNEARHNMFHEKVIPKSTFTVPFHILILSSFIRIHYNVRETGLMIAPEN